MKPLILTAWLLGCGADAASTHYGLNHGSHEIFLTQNPWTNDFIIGGQAAGGSWASLVLSRRKPKLALILSLAVMGVRSSIAVHNIRVAQQNQVTPR